MQKLWEEIRLCSYKKLDTYSMDLDDTIIKQHSIWNCVIAFKKYWSGFMSRNLLSVMSKIQLSLYGFLSDS